MGNTSFQDINQHFQILAERYQRYLNQKIKAYLDNAGYKGIAFMYMLSTRHILYQSYRETPLFRDIINSYEGSFLFNKRTAVAKALETARRLRHAEGNREAFAGRDFVPGESNSAGYLHWLKAQEDVGQEAVGYIPDPRDLLQAGTKQDDFVVKFLVRYHTLKKLIKDFERHFSTEAISLEAEKSNAGEKHERENEAAERIGRLHYPALFRGDEAAEPNSDDSEPNLVLEKHEWLGTQYQLAELFIELERKSWIRKKEVKTIKASFTNSNTIQQVLKPGYDYKEPTSPCVHRKL